MAAWCVLGLTETPKLGQKDSGMRTKPLLGAWVMAGLKTQVLLPCFIRTLHCHLLICTAEDAPRSPV